VDFAVAVILPQSYESCEMHVVLIFHQCYVHSALCKKAATNHQTESASLS